jgi:hypothetical protein
MCRYGGEYYEYKRKYACFACRKAFKRPAGRDLPDASWKDRDPAPCPDCGRPMAHIGRDFKPPRRDEVEAWAVAEHLFGRGFHYHTCGCNGPGYRPTRWADVPAFLAQHRRPSAGEVLLARFQRR